METRERTVSGTGTADLKALKKRFLKYRRQTREICHPLKYEDHSAQPMVDVSPPKWHLAHTTWFFENFVLVPYKKGYRVFDEEFCFLFNSYYETVGERLARDSRGSLTRPSIDRIYDYRSHVDEELADFLESDEIPQNLADIIEIGLQHEQQHQELLVTDIKYILGCNPTFPEYLPPSEIFEEPLAEHPLENYLEIPEGIYSIGHEREGFAFDNEKRGHKVFLHPFKMMERLATNSEYLEFIEAGGYKDFRFWLQEGWEWIKSNKISSPLYWHKIDGDWYVYSLRGLKPLSPFDPVAHISYYEADAFARWKDKRLLTEFEWEAAAKTIYKKVPENANFLENGHFSPVNRQNFSSQLFGDVWEWTCSAYLPYPGFNTPEGALGEYNGKFMINQMVLRGGSCATPLDHIRHSYRNFFHPDKRWQFTGIRLAETI
jgi:ergothioneine biosynthesis protein EgtB